MRRRAAWLLVAAMFVLFAAVQYDDPDKWVWIGVYGTACLLAAAAAAGLMLWRAAAALALVCGSWSSTVFSRVLGTRKWFGEEGRESMGLALVAIAMIALCWTTLRASRARARSTQEREVAE